MPLPPPPPWKRKRCRWDSMFFTKIFWQFSNGAAGEITKNATQRDAERQTDGEISQVSVGVVVVAAN